MRKRLISLILLCTTILASCGGGASNPVEVIRIASVTRNILLRCLEAPSSLDELLLGCLSGTVSTGLDASGQSCVVSFSSSLLQIATAGFQGSIPYQRSTGARDTTYLYDRFSDAKTGAFNFSVNASNSGAAYFGFSFSSNPATDGGKARFGFEVAPAVPGGPKVAVQCTVPI